MNEEQSLKEFQEVMQRVVNAETDDFFELAKILGRDPKTDLVGADLSEVNFQGGNLEGANLRCTELNKADLSNVNLRSADLSRADLRAANLSYADLTNANLRDANLTDANLTGTKLNNTKVENARFRNNSGIDKVTKQDLKTKSALVEDSQNISIKVKTDKLSIAGFLRYTFLGKTDEFEYLVPIHELVASKRIVEIAELSDVPEQNIKPKVFSQEQFISKIIVPINWLLLGIGTVSFSIIVYKTIFLRSEIASEIIYHSFSLILGWFGGVLTSYLREHK